MDKGRAINIVFDGPPGPSPGRFVEVEDDNEKSINVGEWLQKGNYWKLRIDALPGDNRMSVLWKLVDSFWEEAEKPCNLDAARNAHMEDCYALKNALSRLGIERRTNAQAAP